MLKNNLKDISNIVLLRSDKILYDLLNIDSYEKLDKNLSYEHGMRDFYSNSFRKGAIENSMNHTLSHSDSKFFTLDYEFDFLDELFDNYLKFDGNHIYAKSELLDKYSSVISKIHPFNIIGHKLAKLYNQNHFSFTNIKEFTKYITPLALSVNRDYKEYAENHLHLGGANDVALNFMALLSLPTNNKFYNMKYTNELPRINEFSYINNGNLSFGNLIDISKYCVSVINDFVLKKGVRTDIKRDLDNLFKYEKLSMIDIDFASFTMIEKLSDNRMNLKDEFLKEIITYKKDGYTTKQWFLYNILLFKTHETCRNRDIRKVIKIFLHIINILRSYMVMSQNIGLSHFSEFFGSSLRKQEKNRHNNIASNIISNGTSKVEAKISPDALLRNDKEFISYKLAFDKEIIKKESTFINKTHEKYFLNTNHSKRNYHFCVHFVRKKDETKKSNDTNYCLARFNKLRTDLKKEARNINNFLYQESHIINKFDFYSKFYSNITRVLEHKKDLENDYIDLTKLITTIDVAGDENRTPPEVFAPIIKYLRRDVKKLDDFKSDYLKYQKDGHDFVENYKLRLSVHAGEDFNHIVTGMRKVHETVKFYGMSDKDRLGHALAIGLNPKEWCELNGDIFVTKQEHLDNLVWLYHQSIEVLAYYKNTDKLRDKYARVIKELYKDIYLSKNDDLSCEIEDMYKAWKLREFCPIVMFSEDEMLNKADEYLKIADFDNEKLCKEEYKKAIDIYKKYHTCASVRKKGDEVIKIEYENINRNLYKYFITDEDLELIEAVQDRLIQKFCEKGIIIETNPSSNVYIAHIHAFDKHPIFRWNPIECDDLDLNADNPKFNKYKIRTSRMKVCVNTDDPAIMPTTLRNEFDLLERTAFGIHSKSKEKIENWCENIRKLGIEIFDCDHQKSEFRRV
ncbi:amidohydrolase family protein [Arcobacter caeni]|uniref:Adenosine deaminase domain-containing protein n=1 Tax=Arcobacter caeni TaxID=1912877 RepID=A0A363D6A3_9BACT|nr:hypothetical protein [Arcobacter caeni]PUE66577.1 hypothetical protein B0174_00570 [Arcobacter caeni]